MAKWSSRSVWIVATAAVFWIAGAPNSSLSQNTVALPNTQPAGQLQMVTTAMPNGSQQIVVLDSAQRSLAVYMVENGNLQLRSVRSLIWDLRMEEFNGAAPLPSELRRAQP